MDVLEAPPISNDDAPLGTFVILSLDPVASVADLKDEEASAAAALLPRGKYLALVFAPDYNAFAPIHVQPLAFEFYGVGHGAPMRHPLACLGLFPKATHPLGWDPLEPSIPLPWSDCYLHFSCHFSAIVTRLHLASTKSALPPSHTMTIIKAVRLAREASEPDEPSEHDDSSENNDSIEHSLSHASSAAPSTGDPVASDLVSHVESPAEHASSRPSTSALCSDDLDKIPTLPPRMRPRVEVWLDLTSTADIGAPRDIIDTLVKLDAIEAEWAKRAAIDLLVDKPRTTQWASDVAAAEPLDPNAEPTGVLPGDVLGDDQVRPEDAIDHKIEAEKLNAPVGQGKSSIPSNASRPLSEDRRKGIPGVFRKLRSLVKRSVHFATKPVHKVAAFLSSSKNK